ncbi:MAG: SURF1 family protein [Pseudomonadota bacterium]
MTSRRRPASRAMVAGLLLLTIGFVALGVWQVERRAWKHALIAAVDTRAYAAPVTAPGAALWPLIDASSDAYRRIRVSGRFLYGHDTLVRAVTDLGAGYWVMTPLDTGSFVVLVNRGFVPLDKRDTVAAAPSGRVTVTGLLRISQPGGAFLRDNDPAGGLWYSRDVAAIARARAIAPIAPYFIDADGALDRPDGPVGGLTVIRFADNHGAYAVTWFGMALLCLWGMRHVLRASRPS